MISLKTTIDSLTGSLRKSSELDITTESPDILILFSIENTEETKFSSTVSFEDVLTANLHKYQGIFNQKKML